MKRIKAPAKGAFSVILKGFFGFLAKKISKKVEKFFLRVLTIGKICSIIITKDAIMGV